MSACPVWCTIEAEHEADNHHSMTFYAQAPKNEVSVSVGRWENPGEDERVLSVHMESWEIEADTANLHAEIRREVSELRAIIDDLERKALEFADMVAPKTEVALTA
ncbi:hypothetical protein QSU92_01120 [Microbacterium sp. ET2]|uniref:DUF6907 domain-containing protein n=1 Tax=Microbacterium albipurpureum TaxID=3050384 RepID=UPI00259CF0D2|nr:hypothetical protein [Microbacterium sp. ET2 (Ac-2212)]WJL95858.1 hypothetical protein QSU92_01120 [Microbacterium sp. ET2 (Ac-2212)]